MGETLGVAGTPLIGAPTPPMGSAVGTILEPLNGALSPWGLGLSSASTLDPGVPFVENMDPLWAPSAEKPPLS